MTSTSLEQRSYIFLHLIFFVKGADADHGEGGEDAQSAPHQGQCRTAIISAPVLP